MIFKESNEKLKNVFNDVIKQYNLLSYSNDYVKSDIDDCEEYMVAEARDVVSTNATGKVVNIDFDTTKIDESTFKLSLVAKNAQDEVIWYIDYGTYPYFSDLYGFNFINETNNKYLYTSENGFIYARDKQSGYTLWKSYLVESGSFYSKILEINDKVFVFDSTDSTDSFYKTSRL